LKQRTEKNRRKERKGRDLKSGVGSADMTRGDGGEATGLDPHASSRGNRKGGEQEGGGFQHYTEAVQQQRADLCSASRRRGASWRRRRRRRREVLQLTELGGGGLDRTRGSKCMAGWTTSVASCFRFPWRQDHTPPPQPDSSRPSSTHSPRARSMVAAGVCGGGVGGAGFSSFGAAPRSCF